MQTTKDFAIAQAKKVLEENGYFTYNLWTENDVRDKLNNPNISSEMCQDILRKSMTNDSTYDQIWYSIAEFGQDFDLRNELETEENGKDN